MKDKMMNNTGMKILSVMIAILIWLLVANTNDPVVTKKFSDISVKVINDNVLTDEGYAYEITEGEAVTITVRGKNSIVGGLSASDFQAVADFSKLSKVDAIPIDVTVKKYSDQLELSLGNVNTMKIREEKVTSTSVPVNVDVKGEAAEGYAIGKAYGTPNLVKVTGPENMLNNIKEIKAEVKVDGISEDVTTTVKPVLYDKEGNVVDSNQIDMDASTISVFIEVWKTKSVKVNLDVSGKPASGHVLVNFDYEPKKITIAAPDSILKNLEEIDLGNIDLDGLTENYESDFNITEHIQEDDVILVDETSDIKVKATIEKIINRTLGFTAKDITIKGNNNNREVTFDKANKYSMTIEGASSVINNLRISDFDPWINVEGLEEGEHELTVHVKELEGVTVEQTAIIKVTLGE